MFILERVLAIVRAIFGLPIRHDRPRTIEALDDDPSASPSSTNMLEAFVVDNPTRDPLRQCSHCHISFQGGPLDGHHQWLPVQLDDLATTVAVPIDPHRLAALSTNEAMLCGASHGPTSVAVYAIDRDGHMPTHYIFVGAISPDELRAEHS